MNNNMLFSKIQISGPDSLTKLCLQYVVESSATVLTVIDHLERLSRDRLTLPTTLVDRLLLRFCERRKLDDVSLLFLMGRISRVNDYDDFQACHEPPSTVLKCVRLPDCAHVTARGLHGLRAHCIERLATIGIGDGTNVDDLLECLGHSTISSLSSLDVSWSKHLRQPFKLTKRQLSICELNNLRTLNVSHTKLEDKGLIDIVVNLVHLENLNISSTKVTDISPLRQCRERLQSLRMYNLRACDDDVSMAVLRDMMELRLLDVSIERPDPHRMFVSDTRFRASALIWHQNHNSLPHLEVLDISGRKDITLENLKAFLDCHPKIKFLGLMQTDLCSCDAFLKNFKNLKVAGNFTCEQVETALMYYKDRPQFIVESMEFLYRESLTNPKISTECKIDIMSVILPSLMLYPKKISLLLVTTGFIGNVLSKDLTKVEPKILARIVDNVLVAMENYPTHTKLQENVLMALGNENIYAMNVNFDYRKCGRLAMNCFQHFNINDFHEMSLTICSRAARMLFRKGSPNSIMARREEFTKMLGILRQRIEQGIFDDTLLSILKAFNNFTCNTPENGLLFLEEGGMDVFYNIMEMFPGMANMTKYLLPTTHSIALFEHLRPHLAKEHIIRKLREQLWCDDFLTVFHIAGDLTLLAMEDSKAWRGMKPGSREDTLNDVFARLQTLVAPEELPFVLRSFVPGYVMLSPSVPYQAHLWILYSIYTFCSSDSAHYGKMLVSEGGHTLLKTLMDNENTNTVILKYCNNIFQLLRKEFYV